ncbi:MAG: hypothetical protein NTY45_01640, partial [Elusimicrobia bacterium]|nr:hypothetical protein [Elusimicrobiota bacterium]
FVRGNGTGAFTASAIVDADVPNTITLDNITQVTNRAITDLSGTLAVNHGGTGAASLTGVVRGNGTSAFTASAIADADVPDNITIDGTNNVTWASVNKTGASLSDLGTRNASTTFDQGTLPVARGGTGGNDAASARSTLGAAASGTNADITTLTALTSLTGVPGAIGLYSRTKDELISTTPLAVGWLYFCSDCSPAKVVVSTGTSAGNFAAAGGGTFQ